MNAVFIWQEADLISRLFNKKTFVYPFFCLRMSNQNNSTNEEESYFNPPFLISMSRQF